MRKELGIPSVADRIREINVMIGLKFLRSDPNNVVSRELLQHIAHRTSESRWIQITAAHIQMFGLHELYHARRQQHFPPPWQITAFAVTMPTYPPKKLTLHSPHLQRISKLSALEHIHNLQTRNNIKQTIYTDGSLHSDSGRAGSAVVVHQPDGATIQRCIRINNWASTLQAELFAILVALKLVETTSTDSLIVSDSLSSLLALNSLRSDCSMLVSEARHRYTKILQKGVSVKLLWIPSHVGLREHDEVDELAKLASSKETVEYNFGLSLQSLKNVVRRELANEFEESRTVQTGISRSIVHHNEMCKVKHVYGGSKPVSRLHDVVTARLRLGYRYIWQFGVYGDVDDIKCKVCGQREGHTLEHYVLVCPNIQPFRDTSAQTLQEMATHFIVNDKIPEILNLYPLFASPR